MAARALPATVVAVAAAVLCLLAGRAGAYTLPPYNTACRQVVGDGVFVRTGPGTNYATEAEKLWNCYRVHYMNVKATGSGLEWAKIWWNNKERWVATKYLAVCGATACKNIDAATCSKCNTAKSYLKSNGVPDSAAGEGACLAWYESKYNALTHANNDGSTDYGWWQINNRYWCSPGSSPATNKCGVTCSSILSSPTANAKCAARIYRDTNNWSAWATATKFYCRMGCPCGV